jgi:outer membrane beta-barrel protein
MKITKERGFKVGIVLIAVLWLSLIAASWADAAENSQESQDEYNFNWLDPEKKIYVLQNRRYLKAGRPMVSLMGGTGFSNPYRTTINADARAAFYLTESWGIEGFFTYTRNSANANFNALSGTGSNVLPVIREINSQYGAMVQWVPWYAKINVFNQILYFDWYFAAGAGGINYGMFNSSADGVTVNRSEVTRSDFAVYLGTGHIYHLNERFIVRLDFTSAFYSAPVFGTGGASSITSNLNFGIGGGIRL